MRVRRVPCTCMAGAVDRQLTATAGIGEGTCVISVPPSLQLRYDRIPEQDAPAMHALFDMLPKGSETGKPAWQFKMVSCGSWQAALAQGGARHGPTCQQHVPKCVI